MKDSKKTKGNMVWIVKNRNVVSRVFSSEEKAKFYRDKQSNYWQIFIYPFTVE